MHSYRPMRARVVAQLFYKFQYNLSDAGYVGYTRGNLHERVDGHKQKSLSICKHITLANITRTYHLVFQNNFKRLLKVLTNLKTIHFKNLWSFVIMSICRDYRNQIFNITKSQYLPQLPEIGGGGRGAGIAAPCYPILDRFGFYCYHTSHRSEKDRITFVFY